jgi:hypothetical protein
VGVVAKALEELLHVRVDVRMDPDVLLELGEVRVRGELALEEQVRGLEKPRLLGELLDRVAPVAENPRVAVDVGDGAPARGGVEVGRVVGLKAAVAVVRADLAQVGRTDRAVDDRKRLLPPGAVVRDRERVVGHRPFPFPRVRP